MVVHAFLNEHHTGILWLHRLCSMREIARLFGLDPQQQNNNAIIVNDCLAHINEKNSLLLILGKVHQYILSTTKFCLHYMYFIQFQMFAIALFDLYQPDNRNIF